MKKRILFLCTENSARSQMAEALVNSLYGDQFTAVSAGTKPSRVDKRALKAIKEFGLDGSALYSKNMTDLIHKRFDYTITLCDQAQEECKTLDFGGEHLAWDLADPKSLDIPNPFERALNDIDQRFKMFMLMKNKQTAESISLTPLQLFKCLADETRLLSLLLIIEEQELCVCELTEALVLSQPKVSRHLAQLRECGLLADRRQGQWIFYQLNPLLPDWAYGILQETMRRSVIDLSLYQKRLTAMGDRPTRTAQCC